MANYDPTDGRTSEKFERRFYIYLPLSLKESSSHFEISGPQIKYDKLQEFHHEKPALYEVSIFSVQWN